MIKYEQIDYQKKNINMQEMLLKDLGEVKDENL